MNVQMAQPNVQTVVRRDKSRRAAAAYGAARAIVLAVFRAIAQEQIAASASITQNNAITERRRHALEAHGVMVQHVLRIRFAVVEIV
jgi:hypothetical protein